MSFRDNIRFVSFSWREGRYLDFWSLSHFLSGGLLGLLGYLAPFPFSDTFLIVLVALIIYEMWEGYMRMREVLENRVMDVLLGAGGFVLAYRFAEQYLSREEVYGAIGALAVILALLAFRGWRAYVRRKREQIIDK